MYRVIEENGNSVAITAGRASVLAKLTVDNTNALSIYRNTLYLTPDGMRELAHRLTDAADLIDSEHPVCRECNGDLSKMQGAPDSCICERGRS